MLTENIFFLVNSAKPTKLRDVEEGFLSMMGLFILFFYQNGIHLKKNYKFKQVVLI